MVIKFLDILYKVLRISRLLMQVRSRSRDVSLRWELLVLLQYPVSIILLLHRLPLSSQIQIKFLPLVHPTES